MFVIWFEKRDRASGSSRKWTHSGPKKGVLNWNCMLSRIILIGDHLGFEGWIRDVQLTKHCKYKKYCHTKQSLCSITLCNAAIIAVTECSILQY